MSTTIPVHCLNCSTGASDTLGRWSLIVAGAALFVALGALYIAAREHSVFIRQLKARANFTLTADVETGASPDDPDLIKVAASAVIVRVRVGISNVGTKAAGPTLLNVLVPALFEDPAWVDHRGVRDGPKIAPIPTPELLKMPDGREVQAHWIEKKIPRVALRGGQVAWFAVQVGVPTDLPIRIVAQSDDLPDDVTEVVLDKTIRVRPPD